MSGLVSVIVPVYNVSEYLSHCIDSLIGQTYQNVEIILVNDGSTDGSGDICNLYALKDNRVRVVHKQNGGPSQARNVGLDAIKGEYVLFVDGDDWLVPSAVETLVQKYQSYPELDVIRFAITIIDEKGNQCVHRVLRYGDRIFSKQEAFEMWMKAEAWHGICAMYRSSLIQDLRFPVGEFSEDLEFTLQLFLKKEFKTLFVESPLYYYRYNSTGTTHSRSVIMWRDASLHWVRAIEQTENKDPKMASQLAYGLFKQLRQEEAIHRQARTRGEILKRLQEAFAPAYQKLNQMKIDFQLSETPLNDKLYWYLPWMFRCLRPRDWGVESIRKLK